MPLPQNLMGPDPEGVFQFIPSWSRDHPFRAALGKSLITLCFFNGKLRMGLKKLLYCFLILLRCEGAGGI